MRVSDVCEGVYGAISFACVIDGKPSIVTSTPRSGTFVWSWQRPGWFKAKRWMRTHQFDSLGTARKRLAVE